MEAGYDIIVVGGGTAGITAAIQAGRAGARTFLVAPGDITYDAELTDTGVSQRRT